MCLVAEKARLTTIEAERLAIEKDEALVAEKARFSAVEAELKRYEEESKAE